MNKFFYAILFFVFTSQFYAGAWTRNQGSGYYQLSFQYLSSDKFYDDQGNKINSLATLTDIEVSFYAEYGITDAITLTTYIPGFKHVERELNDGVRGLPASVPKIANRSGISDFEVGTRIKLLKSNQTFVSASLLFGIPTGSGEIEKSLLLGDGEFNQSLFLNVGHSLYPLPLYLSGSVGYNNRSEGYSDQFITKLEGGISLFERRLLLMIKLKALFSLNNGDRSSKGGVNKLFSDDQQYLAVTPEAAYKILDNFGINASVTTGGMTENIISALVYRVGIYYTH